jgi:hypothetical protein
VNLIALVYSKLNTRESVIFSHLTHVRKENYHSTWSYPFSDCFRIQENSSSDEPNRRPSASRACYECQFELQLVENNGLWHILNGTAIILHRLEDGRLKDVKITPTCGSVANPPLAKSFLEGIYWANSSF